MRKLWQLLLGESFAPPFHCYPEKWMWRGGTVDHMEGYYGSVIYTAWCHTHLAKRIEMAAASWPGGEHKGSAWPAPLPSERPARHTHPQPYRPPTDPTNSMAKHLRKCLTAKVFPFVVVPAVLKVPNNWVLRIICLILFYLRIPLSPDPHARRQNRASCAVHHKGKQKTINSPNFGFVTLHLNMYHLAGIIW